MSEAHSPKAQPELAPLPNISGADFRIFEGYADIDPNLKAQIEAVGSFDEQDKYMARLAEKLGKDPDAKITDISQLGMAPPPLPTGEDAKETRLFQAAKSRSISGTRAKSGAPYRGPEALTAPLPAASAKPTAVRGDDALTLPRKAAAHRGPPPVPKADDKKTRVISKGGSGRGEPIELTATDLEEVMDEKAQEDLQNAIKLFKKDHSV